MQPIKAAPLILETLAGIVYDTKDVQCPNDESSIVCKLGKSMLVSDVQLSNAWFFSFVTDVPFTAVKPEKE